MVPNSFVYLFRPSGRSPHPEVGGRFIPAGIEKVKPAPAGIRRAGLSLFHCRRTGPRQNRNGGRK